MNAFKPTDGSTLNAHWGWKNELLGTQEKPTESCNGRLVRVNEELMHFTDHTGEQVHLALHGTPPELSDEELLQTAGAMENALLTERANRLPIY